MTLIKVILSPNKQNTSELRQVSFLLKDLKLQKCKFVKLLLVCLGSRLHHILIHSVWYVFDFCEVEIPLCIENKICGNFRICLDWLFVPSAKENLGFSSLCAGVIYEPWDYMNHEWIEVKMNCRDGKLIIKHAQWYAN